MKINVNCHKLKSSLAVALLLLASVAGAANTVRIFNLSADDWARPRSGDVIPELASVRAAVSYWGRGVDALVVIRHPGEDSGELWAADAMLIAAPFAGLAEAMEEPPSFLEHPPASRRRTLKSRNCGPRGRRGARARVISRERNPL